MGEDWKCPFPGGEKSTYFLNPWEKWVACHSYFLHFYPLSQKDLYRKPVFFRIFMMYLDYFLTHHDKFAFLRSKPRNFSIKEKLGLNLCIVFKVTVRLQNLVEAGLQQQQLFKSTPVGLVLYRQNFSRNAGWIARLNARKVCSITSTITDQSCRARPAWRQDYWVHFKWLFSFLYFFALCHCALCHKCPYILIWMALQQIFVLFCCF